MYVKFVKSVINLSQWHHFFVKGKKIWGYMPNFKLTQLAQFKTEEGAAVAFEIICESLDLGLKYIDLNLKMSDFNASKKSRK